MAEADVSIIVLDDTETHPSPGEIIDVDKEYETEEGEIEETNESTSPAAAIVQKEDKLDVSVQCLTSSPEPRIVPASSEPEIQPTFEINFRNRGEFDKFSDAVLKALKESEMLSEPKFEYVTSDKHTRIQAFGIEMCRIDNTDNGASAIPVYDINCDENSNDSIDFGADLNKLFTIDSTPSEKLEVTQVPSYKRHSRDVLDIEAKPKQIKVDVNACPRPRPSTACFNCGSYDHGIRDCLIPRNSQRIARAKRAHALKNERYHVDVDQRFAHLKPGEISEKLRKALSLRKNELPGFFLRMRACGYPPGWLEQSKVSHSGLAMFNTNDDVLKCEENSEECEIKYDISKIIEFPGFNVMPEGYRDDYKYYNVPPYSHEYSKEAMITALGDTAIKGFKRKKLKDHTEGTANIPQADSDKFINEKVKEDQNEEMEIDNNVDENNVEFIRPMPPPETDLDLPPPPPPLPPIETDDSTISNKTEENVAISTSSSTESHNTNRSQSPTLEELQARQRDLLMKLTNGDDDSQNDAVEQAIIASEPVTPATSESSTTPLASSPQKSGKDLQYIIKTSHIGTPVLKFSPFDKIPATDNFKVGVSDVINFENLPDSTGKYEAMKEVLSKVRQAKKRLAEEDD